MTGKLSAFLVVILVTVVAWLPPLPPPRSRSTDCGTPPSLVNNGALEIPFRFEIAGTGATVKGSFFNGDEKTTSTSGSLENGTLTLNFDELGTKLEATLKDGQLDGEYSRGTRGAPYPFHAKRFTPSQRRRRTCRRSPGSWNVQVGKSAKGEAAWQLIVRQSGAEVSAAILRIDGDTGTLTGRIATASSRSATSPARGRCASSSRRRRRHARRRPEHRQAAHRAARRAGGGQRPAAAERSDALHQREESDRAVPFQLPRSRRQDRLEHRSPLPGKVVIVTIGGSWCPNCHDEAPFLVELYRKYKSKGLEIVEFSFEEEAQQKNPVRVRAFNKQYGIEYTVLIPGEPKELNEKVPQGVNLNSFPTTFFLGRDGRVRSAHAGFAGKASGKFHTELMEEETALVERLLAEKPAQTSACK